MILFKSPIDLLTYSSIGGFGDKKQDKPIYQ